MMIDRRVLAFAGLLSLAGAVLSWLHGPGWLLLNGFVGLNLLQMSVTRFCPAAPFLRALDARRPNGRPIRADGPAGAEPPETSPTAGA